MNISGSESDFTKFLADQTNPKKPTPKEIEWSRKRFSSRVEPPKA